jgi:hypothetical protein
MNIEHGGCEGGERAEGDSGDGGEGLEGEHLAQRECGFVCKGEWSWRARRENGRRKNLTESRCWTEGLRPGIYSKDGGARTSLRARTTRWTCPSSRVRSASERAWKVRRKDRAVATTPVARGRYARCSTAC